MENKEHPLFPNDKNLGIKDDAEINTTGSQNTPTSKEPIYVMDLELEKGKTVELKIYEDSDPEELSYEFCHSNGLDFNSMKFLQNELRVLMENFRQKLLSKTDEQTKPPTQVNYMSSNFDIIHEGEEYKDDGKCISERSEEAKINETEHDIKEENLEEASKENHEKPVSRETQESYIENTSDINIDRNFSQCNYASSQASLDKIDFQGDEERMGDMLVQENNPPLNKFSFNQKSGFIEDSQQIKLNEDIKKEKNKDSKIQPSDEVEASLFRYHLSPANPRATDNRLTKNTKIPKFLRPYIQAQSSDKSLNSNKKQSKITNLNSWNQMKSIPQIKSIQSEYNKTPKTNKKQMTEKSNKKSIQAGVSLYTRGIEAKHNNRFKYFNWKAKLTEASLSECSFNPKLEKNQVTAESMVTKQLDRQFYQKHKEDKLERIRHSIQNDDYEETFSPRLNPNKNASARIYDFTSKQVNLIGLQFRVNSELKKTAYFTPKINTRSEQILENSLLYSNNEEDRSQRIRESLAYSGSKFNNNKKADLYTNSAYQVSLCESISNNLGDLMITNTTNLNQIERTQSDEPSESKADGTFFNTEYKNIQTSSKLDNEAYARKFNKTSFNQDIQSFRSLSNGKSNTFYVSKDFTYRQSIYKRKKQEGFYRISQGNSRFTFSPDVNKTRISDHNLTRVYYTSNDISTSKISLDAYDRNFNIARKYTSNAQAKATNQSNILASRNIERIVNKSDAIFKQRLEDRFMKVFKFLDSDYDNVISSICFSTRKLSSKVLSMVWPLLEELKRDEETLTCEEFLMAMGHLYRMFSYSQKNDFIKEVDGMK